MFSGICLLKIYLKYLSFLTAWNMHSIYEIVKFILRIVFDEILPIYVFL